MAFPFEPTQLRAQLRAFALSTNDDTQTACRIVKPLVLGLYYDQYNQEYLKDFRSVSPPIPSELPPEVGKSVPLQLGHHKRYNRKSQQKPVSKAVHKKAASQSSIVTLPQNLQNRRSFAESVLSTSTIDEDISDNLVTTISESGKKKKKRLKDKLRNPLTKLFQKSDASRLHDDSDSSSGQITLESDHDEDSKSLDTSALLIMPADETRRLNNLKLQDGELVVVAEMETGHAPTKKERDYRLDDSFGGASDGDNTVDDDVLEDELEESSSDSAFTDIEADSMIDVDSIEYTVPESYVLEEAQSKYNSKKKGRKMKQSSASLLEKSGKPLNADSLLADLGVDAYSKSSSTRLDKSLQLLPRRSSFTFEKIYNTLDAEPKLSNLSKLIDSRLQSTVNALNYYSFVNSDLVDGAVRAKIDIFLPPETTPVFKDMEFSANVAITDCIGYILLSLSKLPEYKEKLDAAFMNPNNWRLELIDEDGELYDSSFGVLDRSRLLASYNCPNLLALCRVTNPAEIASNNKQSPLPLDFKQNLEQNQRKAEHSKNPSKDMELSPGAENLHDNSIEVKVTNLPGTTGNTFVSFFVNSKMTIEQFIDHISHLYHVDPTKYKLAELAPTNKREKSTMLIDDSDKDEWQNPANNSDALGDLASQKFKLVPNYSRIVRPISEAKANALSISEAAITPSSSAFTPLGITPPVTSLEGKFQEMTNDSKEKPQPTEAKPQNHGKDVALLRKASKDLLSFGDVIHAKNSQLPTSLNTIYFKWKVFRKKSPILNRIEKALILDGDYIHLAPTDDTNWKKNPYDNPFTQNSTTNSSTTGNANSHHHHHYLHHYNYSKYYNDTMMKTSSFHITQIIKLKQYKQSKNPNHFKIVIKKEYDQGGKETVVKKKYDLEAQDVAQCEEIIEKIKWALQVYNMSNIS